jgi:hypothetical protein
MSDARSGSIPVNTDGHLTLSFRPIDDDLTLGTIELALNGQSTRCDFYIGPAEIALFLRQLEWMHRDLSGSASIRGDRDMQVEFRMTDPRRGAVSVSGRFRADVYPGSMTVQFDDLMTDQSALPEFLRDLAGAS